MNLISQSGVFSVSGLELGWNCEFRQFLLEAKSLAIVEMVEHGCNDSHPCNLLLESLTTFSGSSGVWSFVILLEKQID